MLLVRGFQSVLSAGRRKAYIFGIKCFKRRENFLLSINDLVKFFKPRSEIYQGVHAIRVDRIIGTEDRSNDFSVSFLPINAYLGKRWTRVRDLLLNDKIAETNKVIEYGGYYFVRDGNHRVSVAKTHGIDYLDVEIIRFGIPVKLPSNMTLGKILILQAKLKFYNETHLFDHIPEEEIGDAHPESWDKLQHIIFDDYKRRLTKRNGISSSTGELICTWYKDVFTIAMDLTKKQAIPTLFPEWYDLDIFCSSLSFLLTHKIYSDFLTN